MIISSRFHLERISKPLECGLHVNVRRTSLDNKKFTYPKMSTRKLHKTTKITQMNKFNFKIKCEIFTK